MKKRLLSLFLALVMALSPLPVTAYAEEETSHESVCQDMLSGTGEEMAEGIEAFPEGFTLTPPAEGEEDISPSYIGDNAMSESEPNNYESSADRIYHDYTVSGYLSGTDLDYFKFTLSSQSKVTILAVAQYSSFMMGIYNSSGTLLVKDITGSYSDGYYRYDLTKILSSGTYYLCLLDSAQRSQNVYTFYITIESPDTHTHSYTASYTVPPTCGDYGYTVYVCSCGLDYQDDYVGFTDQHDFVFQYTISPICSWYGFDLYRCSVCSLDLQENKVPATGRHYWGGASCTENRTCSVCQETRTASAHAWTEATCIAPRTCTECQATEGEALGHLGHSWTDATCTNPKTCSVCQETEGEALGHSWTDATCTEPKTCSVCQLTEGEALGHSWSEGSCTEPKVCAACQSTQAAPGHTWTDATCTTPKTCSVCQATEGEPLGHTWTDATCTDPKTCSVCQTTDGEPLGHDWFGGSCTDPKTCSICKATEDAPGHSWTDATCTAPQTCSVCYTTQGEALDHRYDNDQDAVCNVCGHVREVVTLSVPSKPYKIANVISGVHVYWRTAEDAQQYGLWRSSTGKNGTYELITTTTALHYIDKTTASGRTYHYKLTSYDASTNTHSDKSESLGIVFVGTPTFTLRVNRAVGIGLRWTEIEGATGYGIYRKSYSGTDAWVRVGTVSGGSNTAWDDTSVRNANGTVYKYTVRALAGSNMKTLSGCYNNGFTMVRITSLTLNSAVQATKNSIKCSWTKNAQVTGYEVRFMVGSKVYNTWTIGNINTVSRTFTNLPTGQTYKIQVRSYKKVEGVGSFYSAWSTAKNVTLP